MQDDQHFDDEGNAEEKRNAAHGGIAAAALEGLVINPVGDEPEHEQKRRDQKPRHQRIDVVAVVEEKDRIGRQHQKGGMRHMGNVEQAEGDRQPDADGCIKAAEQHPGHHRVEQQVH